MFLAKPDVLDAAHDSRTPPQMRQLDFLHHPARQSSLRRRPRNRSVLLSRRECEGCTRVGQSMAYARRLDMPPVGPA